MIIVGIDNFTDNRVPKNIYPGKMDDFNTRHPAKSLLRLKETGGIALSLIHLSTIPRHNTGRSFPQPREKHEHLLPRCILSLIENNAGL